MIMQSVLNSTNVRNEFSKFVDTVVHEKPQAVRRNRDIFWSFSHAVVKEILARYNFAIEYEREEDGSYSGSLIPFDDIVVFGETYEEMIEDAAIQLKEYAEDYYNDFNRYYYAPNRRSHLPYILNILIQEDLEGVKKLIDG